MSRKVEQQFREVRSPDVLFREASARRKRRGIAIKVCRSCGSEYPRGEQCELCPGYLRSQHAFDPMEEL